MPFIDDYEVSAPLGLPEGLDLNPQDRETTLWQTMGAAFRTENTIGSMVSYRAYEDATKRYDPDYRPWEDIQGTRYQDFAERFVGARDADDVRRMKLQIDQENEDAATLGSAGALGFGAQMLAAVLSPSTLLPGGALVKGGKGIAIGRTGLTVGSAAAAAAFVDELALQGTQVSRPIEESAFAVGGSFILGGALGVGMGKLGQKAMGAAMQTEKAVQTIHDAVEVSRSLGAASVAEQDLRLRNEAFIQAIKKVPGARWTVQSDPLIRLQTADSQNARLAVANLAESPSAYRVNEDGQSVLQGDVPVEVVIKDRRYQDETKAVQGLRSTYAEYMRDGPVGTIGTMTAPITQTFASLAGKTDKLSFNDFMDEVGKAMFAQDAHPIPQVATAAKKLRDLVFAKAEQDLMDLGVLPPDFKLENGESYFSRIYRQGLIDAHWGDGTELDMKKVLVEEFSRKRAAAQQELANDRTLDLLQADEFQQKERARTAQQALDRATRKARDKRDRATNAIKREQAVGRATGFLRRAFKQRSEDLKDMLVTDGERAAMREAVMDARGAERLRPVDMLQAVRGFGGIKDDGSGELAAALDTKLPTIKRAGGLDPDRMTEALIEAGYLPDGSSVNDMWEAMARAARGEDIFSIHDAVNADRYSAALEFASSLEDIGLDINDPIDKIIKAIPEKARSQKVTKAKSQEAGRSSAKSGKAEAGAAARVEKAIERLEDAQARIAELEEFIGPRVKSEIKDALEELRNLKPKIQKAADEKSLRERLANMDDLDVEDVANEVRNSIVGLKPGQPHFRASGSSPMKARMLDVPSEALLPWLDTNAERVLGQYMRHTIPEIEMRKKFGSADLQAELLNVRDEYNAKIDKLPANSRKRKALTKERDRALKDIEGIRDRLLGNYGLPSDPKSWWVTGGRVGRALSYPAFLGNMTLAAIPDIANVVGRGGIETAFGAAAFMDPKRAFTGMKEAAEFGAFSEIYLNGRAQSLAEMFDPYGAGSRLERVLAEAGSKFSVVSGMVPWNAFWKSYGGMVGASRMSKAIDAAARGKATKKQNLLLGQNYLTGDMVDRIAKQLDAYGDKDGALWIPHGADWDDPKAYEAFRRAMQREVDLMVITPGQEVPLTFSNEGMKFFLQFKRFAWSMHHRLVLAGISKADAELAAQVTLLVSLGGLVSNIRADLGGYERKEGAAFWEDAIDRSGVAGWLMEPYNAAGAMSGGRLSIGGEPVSRFQSRSFAAGALGPTFDMAAGMVEASNAFATGKASYRDARKIMRPIPGNNAAHLQWIFQNVEDAIVDATGARPRDQ